MGRLWVPLDVDFQDDDRMIGVSLEAELLFVRSLALAKRLASDGRIRLAHLRRLSDKLPGDPEKYADELIGAGLWDTEGTPGTPSERYVIVSWLRWNAPADDLDGVREAKRAGGKRGNHRRYGHPGSVDTCPKCNPPVDASHSETSDPRTASAVTSHSHSPETETETENPHTHTPARPRARGKTLVPDDWEPNDHHHTIAAEEHIDVTREADRFRDYCHANDKRYKNHDRAFNNWLRNDNYRAPTRASPNGEVVRLTAAEQRTQRNRDNIAAAIAEQRQMGMP